MQPVPMIRCASLSQRMTTVASNGLKKAGDELVHNVTLRCNRPNSIRQAKPVSQGRASVKCIRSTARTALILMASLRDGTVSESRMQSTNDAI